MSRILNHFGSFFPKLQKDFKIHDGDVFPEVYDGDFYDEIPYSKYINENLKLPLDNAVYVRDFGAIPNNTTINNADAINNTIAGIDTNTHAANRISNLARYIISLLNWKIPTGSVGRSGKYISADS